MQAGIDYGKLNPDRRSGEPLHLQLYSSLVREIRSLSPRERVVLMSERELSLLLKLNRCTTHRAYEQLIDEHLVRRMPDKSLVVRSDARTRITGAYPVIGVLLPTEFDELVEYNNRSVLPYLEGLIGRCSKQKISCIMLRPPSETASPAPIEAFAKEHFSRLCGVIHLGGLAGSGINDDPVLEQILKHTEIPQVCISGRVPSESAGSVYTDPVQGLDEMCRVLKERGFRRAGVIGMKFSHVIFQYTAAQRFDAMCEALRRNGLECVFQSNSPVPDPDITAQLLDRPDRPEILLCHNDQIAESVLKQAREKGIRIPDDLALAGYDTRSQDPFLASVSTSPYDIAAAAVDMVMDHFENGVSADNRIRILPTRFVDGESLKKPEADHG